MNEADAGARARGDQALDHSRPTVLTASPEAIERGADELAAGRLLAFPTETVYGLGADAANPDAVAGIYRLKGRPPDHPLIVHVTGIETARQWAEFNEAALRLAQAFWPGPLTLILRRNPWACDAACGGQTTIGLRAPAHPVAIALLKAFERRSGSGVAAPSANRFGRVSPTRAQHVIDDLGTEAPLVIDGGDCAVGLESTIVDLSRDRPALLRPGGLAVPTIEAVLGCALAAPDALAPRVSGSLAAHYAPRTPLELLPASVLESRLRELSSAGLSVAVWSRARPDGPHALWRKADDHPDAMGQALYAGLRELDRAGVSRILVERPPSDEAWRAIADRLARAEVGASMVEGDRGGVLADK